MHIYIKLFLGNRLTLVKKKGKATRNKSTRTKTATFNIKVMKSTYKNNKIGNLELTITTLCLRMELGMVAQGNVGGRIVQK